MDGIIRVVKTTFAVIILLVITMISILARASSNTENEYKKLLDSINKGNYSEALKIAEWIPHYKDSSELYIYVYPHKLYMDKYSNLTETIEGYKSAINYIEAKKNLLNGTQGEKYIAELLDLEKVLNFKISALTIKIEDYAANKLLNEGVGFIKQADYPKAIEKLNGINESSMYAIDKHQLLNYINLLNAITAEDKKAIEASIELLNPAYGGVLKEEINTAVTAQMSPERWSTMYIKKAGDTPPKVSVAIGMKKDALVQALGSPVNSEVIKNKYGSFEKMNFADRVVYLENDEVVSVR